MNFFYNSLNMHYSSDIKGRNLKSNKNKRGNPAVSANASCNPDGLC